MREAWRHLLTVGDHDDHVLSRRTQQLPENQPKPMPTDEIMRVLRDA